MYFINSKYKAKMDWNYYFLKIKVWNAFHKLKNSTTKNEQNWKSWEVWNNQKNI